MGLLPMLAVAFIVLKLCGVIAWSWLWVLSPLWIPVAVAFVAFVALATVAAFVGLCRG